MPRVHWLDTFFLQIDTTRSVLNLYTDASKTTLIRSVNAANLTPFVINADGFAYTFSDKGKPDVAVKSWGYRIVVSPIWRLQVGARSSFCCSYWLHGAVSIPSANPARLSLVGLR